MRPNAALSLAVFASLIAVAACGAGSKAPACPQSFPIPPQMVIPAPGATAVPVNTGMEVSYSGDIAAWSAPTLVPSKGGSVVIGSPFALVPTPGPIVYSSNLPALQSGTTYSVQLRTPPSGSCQALAQLGSFTTQ